MPLNTNSPPSDKPARVQPVPAPEAHVQTRWAGRRRPLAQNVEILAALALAAVYLATMSGHLQSIDGLLVYEQSRALTYDQSFRFAAPVGWTGAETSVSKYGIGLSLTYVPGLVLWSWLKPYVPAGPTDFPHFYSDPLYTLAAAPVHILVTVLAAYVLAKFCYRLGFSRSIGLLALVLYGVASPAVTYARGDFAQPLEGLCWILGLYSAFAYSQTRRAGWLIVCAGSVAMAVLTRLVESTMLIPAVTLVATQSIWVWRWKRWQWVGATAVFLGTAVGVAGTLYVNYQRWGSMLKSGYEGEGWYTPLLEGLSGSLFSPVRGILWQFPAVMVAPLGLYVLWSRGYRALSIATAFLALAQLLNVATWSVWWGGWAWGLRLYVTALPVIALLAVAGITALPRLVRPAFTVFAVAAGVLWAVPTLLIDLLSNYAETYDGTANAFRLDGHPAAAISRFLDHWYAETPVDRFAADILWIRTAGQTGSASLIPMIALLVCALALAARVCVLQGYFTRWQRISARRAVPSLVEGGEP
ncbi:MAG TPA: hypothetical protein VF914_01940 [Chloroflexia bacterium]